jgi:hypothetical protein
MKSNVLLHGDFVYARNTQMSSTQRLRPVAERKIAATIEEGGIVKGGNSNRNNVAPKNNKKKTLDYNFKQVFHKYVAGAVLILYIFFQHILSDQWQFETLKFLLSLCGIKTAFKSQHGQDRYAYKTFFPNAAEGGTFVEFGARDGVSHSNTYFFEHVQKWHGVLLEPGPEFFKIGKNRPRSISFHNTACMQDAHENKKRIFIVADIQGW